eukprot:COSAG01_NODE_14897_length_1397_cov_2.782743_1_plen_173_part_00
MTVGETEISDDLPISALRRMLAPHNVRTDVIGAIGATSDNYNAAGSAYTLAGTPLDPDGDVLGDDDDGDAPCSLVQLLAEHDVAALPNELRLAKGVQVAYKFDGSGWELGRVREEQHRCGRRCGRRCAATHGVWFESDNKIWALPLSLTTKLATKGAHVGGDGEVGNWIIVT